MFIKWIKCTVQAPQIEFFSKAQQKWTALRQLKGFIAQAGGWSDKNTNEAYIISVWETEETYQAFMRDAHDDIYALTGQQGTFEEIKVTLLEGIGEINPPAVIEAFQNGISLNVEEQKQRDFDIEISFTLYGTYYSDLKAEEKASLLKLSGKMPNRLISNSNCTNSKKGTIQRIKLEPRWTVCAI